MKAGEAVGLQVAEVVVVVVVVAGVAGVAGVVVVVVVVAVGLAVNIAAGVGNGVTAPPLPFSLLSISLTESAIPFQFN